ncbi:MAG: YdeI/OmpD-associated family protein [Actinomycetota bacterium]|nr:YdeI/OmpD-associated family protein [Actinomycetota bacterium]
MQPAADLPIIAFDSQPEWERWLEGHHATAAGVWMKIAKKASGVQTASYPGVLDSAICFGWIDGQRRPLDERFFLQRFTPRRRRSKWSRVNRDKAERLIEEARMRPAGLAEVQRAREDGRWQAAYEPQSAATVPEDLRRALERNPHAQAFFATLDRQNRYAVLFRIQDAKRPETRARRIEKFIAMLEAGEKLHP